MRIGIDCRLWNQTGVGRYIRNLIINLQKIDEKNSYVIFVRSEDYQDIKALISNTRWQIVRTDIKWHSFEEQYKFPKILNREKLDLVHFPYFSLPIFYNKPYVVTIHDLIVHHFPTGKASTLAFPIYKVKLIAYRFVIKKAAWKAKKIITVSNATKDEVLDHLKVNKDKAVVIHNGVDEKIKNHPFDKLRTRRSKIKNQNLGKYFLYVGNAYPHKNLERLLLAFSKFSLNNKNTKLVLVGKKDYFYKRLEKKIKDEKIVFYGAATDEELSNLYQGALCLIMPSLMEGFGLPVLEAMANRCLVICSDIPPLREIAKDSALYFNPKNVSEINKAMNEVYYGKYDKGIIENAYKLTKEYSFEKMAKQTLKVYESLLKDS